VDEPSYRRVPALEKLRAGARDHVAPGGFRSLSPTSRDGDLRVRKKGAFTPYGADGVTREEVCKDTTQIGSNQEGNKRPHRGIGDPDNIAVEGETVDKPKQFLHLLRLTWLPREPTVRADDQLSPLEILPTSGEKPRRNKVRRLLVEDAEKTIARKSGLLHLRCRRHQ
jgi:hypothetical protein